MNNETVSVRPSALLGFRAGNARSFRDEFVFSLEATALSEPAYVREVPWREGGSPMRVLPAAGFFGANASGKSNVLEAMDDMRRHVLHSFRSGAPGSGMPHWPFRLNPQSVQQPTTFEVTFILDGVLHEYGFSHDSVRVFEEWAYYSPKGRSAMLFHREGDDVRLGPVERTRGRAARDLLRSNALFLSTAAAAGHPVLSQLYQWFAQNMRFVGAFSRPWRQALTAEMLDDNRHRNSVLGLLRSADLGIVGVNKNDVDPLVAERMRRAVRILAGTEDDSVSGLSLEIEELATVNLLHEGTDGAVEFDDTDESAGTLVWFGLVGPLLQSLAAGTLLIVDELDASLHPTLVQRLIRIYQEPHSNQHCAQLVFNSHDPTLMGDTAAERLLGRDQIWFTEKLNDGSSQLYPLADLSPRKHEVVSKRYLEGRYGARPILMDGGFESALDQISIGAK